MWCLPFPLLKMALSCHSQRDNVRDVGPFFTQPCVGRYQFYNHYYDGKTCMSQMKIVVKKHYHLKYKVGA